VLSVVIYYIWPDSGAGEKVTLWSILQGGGFLISIFGSFVYNRIVKLPGFHYEVIQDEQKTPHDLVSGEELLQGDLAHYDR
jgi:hypothetical protein